MIAVSLRVGRRRFIFNCSTVLLLLCLGLTRAANAQTLQHEWSFNEAGGTTAVDSVSSSNITLLGGTTLGGGVLNLPGGAGNYAQFPNGILSTYSNSITIETWLTDNGGQTWARAWSFGGSTAGPNNGFTHANYIDLIPSAGNSGGFWTEFNHNGNTDAIFQTPLPTGLEQYAVVVYDAPKQTARLYLNGVQVATAAGIAFHPSDLGFTYNNFLGLDQYNDSVFNGTFDEMRIWDAPVSQRYLSASAIAGPGVIINNLTPTTASLTAGPNVTVTGTEQAVVTVQLPQTGTANLLATADATNWVSSNPNVLTVSSSGVVYGVAPGTATASATISGIPVASGNITVGSQVLQHEWSFNETGGATAADTVGGADLSLLGSSSLGGGVLTLPGGAGNYAQFPNGILSSNFSITIETWLTDNGGQTWARVWSFGGGTAGPNNNKIGNNYIDLIPKAGGVTGLWTEFKAGGVTEDVVDVGNVPLPTGSEKYIAMTYDASKQTCLMYSNGVLVAIGTNITITPASLGYTYNNYLGNDQYNDPIFNGTYDEMRIWDGAMSQVYLLESAAAGPGVVITNTTPQSIAVSAGANLAASQTEPATVTGIFNQVSGVGLTVVATNWTSSNPTVLTVNSNGLISALNDGTATVSATVNGVSATSPPITVLGGPPTITQSFTNQTAVVGDHVTFSAQATGGGLNFQWSFNSNPILNATNSSLLLTNVALSQAGIYSLSISNSVGHTNLSATLTVVPPILQHEWTFNEEGGTTAVDSISSSNITLLGGTSLGGGALNLPGGAGNYAQFPNGIVSSYSNSITIETWFTDNAGLTWARPWSIGGGTTGPNTDFSHANYIDLIPHAGAGGGFWTEFNHNGNTDAIDPIPIPTGVEEYALVTYEVWSHTVRLYLNGVQVATATNVNFSPSDMGFTYNNFLGLDQYNDAIFNGTIDEMRIWNGAVTPLYALVSATAGPGTVVTSMTPSAFNIAVTTGTVVGQTQQATATADFSSVTGVPVNSYVTNWTSSNPSVLSVDATGVITSISAGTATVSGTFQGITSQSALITVAPSAPIITQQPVDSETLMVGATLRIDLGVIGTTPFTYYWYFNNGASPFSITTTPTLIVPNVQLASAGSYSCVVSNSVGTTPSTALTLTVVTPTTYQQAIRTLNPISYWPLNEVSGTTAFDLVGGHNGTYTGAYALGMPGATNAFFDGGTAAGFDGASGHVDIPGAPFNITGPITIVAWVNLISAPGFDGIVGHGDTSWRMTVNGSSQPAANDGSASADAAGFVSIQDSNWHMVVYSYSGTPGQNNNGSLYLDGTLIANNTVTNPAVNNLDVWIGGSPDYSDRFIPADIANVAVFSQALSATQVQDLFNGVGVLGPQNISITRSGANIVLNWQTGTLLQATNLLGPWTTNSAAQPGYMVPISGPRQFFRLLVSP
jgi:uncharacterized protein YjdB